MRECGAHAQRSAVEQQSALAGCLRDAILALLSGVVAVHRGEVGAGDRRGAALDHTGKDFVHTLKSATIGDRGANGGVSVAGFVGDKRRIVDRDDVDGDRASSTFVGLATAAGVSYWRVVCRKSIGRISQIIAHGVAENDLGATGIGQGLTTIMHVAQTRSATVCRGA